jgi:sugar O-acyltransferase (sialic acid O-acetyltransferase NeuD family)
MDREDIAVFGAGGFGLEVAMLIDQINAESNRWRLIGFFDDGIKRGDRVNNLPLLGGIDDLNRWSTPLAVVFAIGMPRIKKKIILQVNNERISYPVLRHPSVICGPKEYVRIGEGTIICAGTIITTNIEIGKHVILNLACTVGHQAVIGDYSSFMPSCNISGEVIVGEASFWGTGAKVINRKHIGAYTKIGAGAVVTTDIPDNVTAVGVPAKVVRSH